MNACLVVIPLLGTVGCGEPSGEYQRFVDEGLMEFRAARYPEAVAMFKGASDIDGERQEASYHLGRCYVAMANGKFTSGRMTAALKYTDMAIATFDRAIAAFPGYGPALQGKMDALKLHDKHAAAMDLAEWAVVNSGLQAQKLIMKAREHALAGDMDAARLAHRKAVAVEPDSAGAHASLGLFYMQCGHDGEAVKALTKAYRLNPGTPGVVSALAQLGALSEVASAP